MRPWTPQDHQRLVDALETSDAEPQPLSRLASLAREGLDALPMPGGGQTWMRWQALARVAQADLSLAKLYEGHTDALAILSELGSADQAPDGLWGVWASESPPLRVVVDPGPDGRVVLRGRTNWCSGARGLTHALLTAWHADGRGPQLVWLDLGQPQVTVISENWQAVGMAASESLDVVLDGAVGHCVGNTGDYLRRPGFWQGGAGIAACWYGGSRRLADTLRQYLVASEPGRTPFRLSALGKVDMYLANASLALHQAASWIDENPTADARAAALHARLTIDHWARLVLEEVGRAVGATPFCRDAGFARAAADLPVFLGQGHAERDSAALGELLIERQPVWWPG